MIFPKLLKIQYGIDITDLPGYIGIERDGTVTLDGKFTPAQLRKIAQAASQFRKRRIEIKKNERQG